MSTIYSNISTKMSGAGSLGGGASRGGGGAWMGGTYAAGGSGLGLGSAAGLGAGLGTGIGLGAGLGVGGYAGGIGVGLGGSGLSLACGSGPGLGLGLANYGGAGAGAGMISPAFTMGRTFAAGGLSGSSALAIGPSLGPSLAPVLSRQAEKQLLSGLNERFSTYMIKVRALQQENMALEANLSQLTGGTDMSPETSTSTIEFEAQISEYRNTLEKLTMDTIKLEVDLDNVRGAAHELKAKFDFEQGVRYQLEADITAMKKDTEMAGDLRVELDAKYGSLKNELDYVTKTQEEELASLQAKLGTTTVDTSVSMIEVDTGNSFDISSALNSIREDYEKTVQRHREEADAYYKIKMEEIQSTTAKNTEAISSAKVEIAGAKKDLQGLGLELQTLLTVNMTLAARMAEAQAQSTVGVADYQSQMASIAGAIDMAKVELQKQILSYQELLDIKLALDVEISTYRKLLEGSDLHVSDSPFHSGTYTFTGGDAPLSSTPRTPTPPRAPSL